MSTQGPLSAKDFTAEEKQLFNPLFAQCAKKELTVQQACEKLGNPALAKRFKLYGQAAKKALIEAKQAKQELEKSVGELQQAKEKLQQSKQELELSKEKSLAAQDKLSLLQEQKNFLEQSIQQREQKISNARDAITENITTHLQNIAVSGGRPGTK